MRRRRPPGQRSRWAQQRGGAVQARSSAPAPQATCTRSEQPPPARRATVCFQVYCAQFTQIACSFTPLHCAAPAARPANRGYSAGSGPARPNNRTNRLPGRGRDRGAGTGRVRVGGPAPLLCRGEGPGDDVPAEGAVVAQQRRDAAAVAQLHRQAQPPLAPLRLPVPYFIYIYIYIYNM